MVLPDEKQQLMREFALLLAKTYETTNDEAPLVFVFDRTLIPQLGASEQIEVKVRRTHRYNPLRNVDIMAGVELA
jgi:hypothetical protein